MTYSINPVEGRFDLPYVPSTGFPATYRYVVMSAWFEFKPDQSGFKMFAQGFDPITNCERGFLVTINAPTDTPPLLAIINVGDGINGSVYFGTAGFDSSALVSGVNYNLLISIDSVGQIVQCYVNDAPLTSFAPPTWAAATPMAEPISGDASTSFGNGQVLIAAGDPVIGTDPCVADAWWGTTTTFFDLASVPNRRLFINADLTPVDLGTDGSIPFGAPPQVYATIRTGGTITDFLTNRGTTGGTFAETGSFALCPPFPTPPPPPPPPPPPSAVLNMGRVTVNSLATESPCTAVMFSPRPRATPSLGLRWSDTRGADWGNPVPQPMSSDPLSQPRWNRTGYARDRVFELFWSSAFKTALNGAFVEVVPWKP